MVLYRPESLLTLWQHHSLSILWCNTKTGLSRNNRQLFMVIASPSDVFISGQPLYGHFCAIRAGYTLFPTSYRPHKPEQNAGE